MSDMTRAERLELTKIVRQRAKLAKDDVDVRRAQLLAEAEAALSQLFSEQDEAWADVTREARRHMDEVQEKVNAICDEKGIPVAFRPSYLTMWMSRGENADPTRRAELRRAVKTRAEASAKQAKLEIDRQSVQLQEQLMAGGFASEEAHRFLESLPTPEDLMPALDLPQLEAGS